MATVSIKVVEITVAIVEIEITHDVIIAGIVEIINDATTVETAEMLLLLLLLRTITEETTVENVLPDYLNISHNNPSHQEMIIEEETTVEIVDIIVAITDC